MLQTLYDKQCVHVVKTHHPMHKELKCLMLLNLLILKKKGLGWPTISGISSESSKTFHLWPHKTGPRSAQAVLATVGGLLLYHVMQLFSPFGSKGLQPAEAWKGRSMDQINMLEVIHLLISSPFTRSYICTRLCVLRHGRVRSQLNSVWFLKHLSNKTVAH